MGKYIGHIVSDLFYINPWDGKYVWKDMNSAVIEATGSKSASKKVPSSFYKSLTVNVQSAKMGDIAGAVLRSIASSDPKSRDDALDWATEGGSAEYEKHIMTKQLKYSE